MTWSPGPVVTRRRLGGELKRLREGLGLKLEDVARSSSARRRRSVASRTARACPRWRDVRDMLDAYKRARRRRAGPAAATGRETGRRGCGGGLPRRARRRPWRPTSSRVGRARGSRVRAAHRPRSAADAATTPAARCDHVWAPRTLRERRSNVSSRSACGARRRSTADHGLTFACVLDESTLYRVVGSTRRPARSRSSTSSPSPRPSTSTSGCCPSAPGLLREPRLVRASSSSPPGRRARSCASSARSAGEFLVGRRRRGPHARLAG